MIKMVFALSLFAIPAFSQTLYDSRQAAHQACPTDTVVCFNTRSGIYHFQGEQYYDNTEQGAFVSEQDAKNNGGRTAENGQ
jgi:hypothetical protein